MITPARPAARRWLALAVTLLVCLLAAWFLRNAGLWLVHEDPLQKADAILVLAGTRMSRPLEAADLYREGWAPRIVLTREVFDNGERALHERGLHARTRPEVVREVYGQLGVPASAVILPDVGHDSTADEARTLRALIAREGWRRVIIVTDKLHTRRARLAIARELEGTPTTLLMRATRYDGDDPAAWWRHRGTARFVLFEWQKFVAYALGLT